jgi:hypothetical protein
MQNTSLVTNFPTFVGLLWHRMRSMIMRHDRYQDLENTRSLGEGKTTVLLDLPYLTLYLGYCPTANNFLHQQVAFLCLLYVLLPMVS